MERMFAPISAETEHVATSVIEAAIEVHRHLGPGFLERIYQEALCLELDARGLEFERERAAVVHYRGVPIPGQRIDLIVRGCVLVELKAAARIDAAHEAKMISYLRGRALDLRPIFAAATLGSETAEPCASLLAPPRARPLTQQYTTFG